MDDRGRSAELEWILGENCMQMDHYRHSKKMRLLFVISPRFRRLYEAWQKAGSAEDRLAASRRFMDALDAHPVWKAGIRFRCIRSDVSLFLRRLGGGRVIDRSDRSVRDYYSVAVIVKNEARYIREFVLFYKATGADRIYLYDNESTDALLGELAPFLRSGFVVYRKWPGRVAQVAAYRDAVRRTKHRTKWLAFIDADEFLFSPKGSMPEQLKKYEQYPGVGANWVMFGPNGHDRRPEGLVMDNYTTTLADYNSVLNRHIKSIVQPEQVRIMHHVHYAWYKGDGCTVDETGARIDSRETYGRRNGRALTASNHRAVFRINHYNTRSLEDLEEKCRRGYPDGTPNRTMEGALQMFEGAVVEDDAIRPYADIVREEYAAARG